MIFYKVKPKHEILFYTYIAVDDNRYLLFVIDLTKGLLHMERRYPINKMSIKERNRYDRL